MGAADEDWVKAAMADDAMVVELLVKLHQTPPRRQPPTLKTAALPLEWTVRQRRSKSISVNNNPKKQAYRASPTTPLSWSGATSFSGGSAEECSRPFGSKISCTARSKVNISNKKNNSKRSRKKTLPELREEETSLMQERRELKRELTALCKNLERARATNEKLKRMKIELQPHLELTSLEEESTPSQPDPDPAPYYATHPPPPVVSGHDNILETSTSNPHPGENTDEPSDSKFVLPDLNVPFDEPICGAS